MSTGHQKINYSPWPEINVFLFNESDEKDILLSLEQAQIHALCMKKRCRKGGCRSEILLRSRRRGPKDEMEQHIYEEAMLKGAILY
jgi:hypothetical protein